MKPESKLIGLLFRLETATTFSVSHFMTIHYLKFKRKCKCSIFPAFTTQLKITQTGILNV